MIGLDLLVNNKKINKNVDIQIKEKNIPRDKIDFDLNEKIKNDILEYLKKNMEKKEFDVLNQDNLDIDNIITKSIDILIDIINFKYNINNSIK
jgi:hypothetical protein